MFTTVEEIISHYTNKKENEPMEKQLLDKISGMLREAYPDAVSVKIFINSQEANIEKEYRQKLDGISMKNLSGNWVRE